MLHNSDVVRLSQGLSFLHLEIALPFVKLCYAFEEKLFFSYTIILWKNTDIARNDIKTLYDCRI